MTDLPMRPAYCQHGVKTCTACDEVMAWRPIESAPTDMVSEFLGWDGEIMDITWVGWYEDGLPVYVRGDYFVWEPIMWRELPSPPEPPK